MSSLPTTLGKYQIIREIARSNDIVYEGYDPLMNRRVALKELSMPRGASSPQVDDRISRFKREAQAVGTLAHPNIMTVYEYGQEGDRHFMSMEYLDGHNLRNEIDTKGFLPPERAVEIATEILKGLGHAHSKGVIHRDIKPDNIQLLSSGEIKITDFGIARLTFQPNLTMDGQVFGTPSYMSPEQVVGKDLDQRSDLFSVGVLLYEMITGQKPFPGDNVISITHSIVNQKPHPPQQASHQLQEVILKALDKTPAMRFDSAPDMLAALQNAMKPPDAFDPHLTHSQTAHNPWATTAPPSYNYGAPVPQTQSFPQAPTPQYPYNPYAQLGQFGAPHVPGMPPPGLPTWYPPPPRPPLMKAETKLAVARAFLWFLIIGSVVGAILIAISMVARNNPYQDEETHRHVPAVSGPQVSAQGGTPIDENGRPIATPAAQLNPSSDVPTATVEEVRTAFGHLQRDHPNPDTADLASAEMLLQQLGDHDPNLKAQIEAYMGQPPQ